MLDAQGNTLFDTGLFTFPGNTVFSYPASPIRSSVALRVYISDFGDLGLDDFQFSQTATVPEPGTWALLWMAGVGQLGALARRRRALARFGEVRWTGHDSFRKSAVTSNALQGHIFVKPVRTSSDVYRMKH